MSITITVEEASNQLSEILMQLSSGASEIILSRSGSPVARILPIYPHENTTRPRVPGSAKGEIVIADDFDAPLPDELINLFYDGAIEP